MYKTVIYKYSFECICSLNCHVYILTVRVKQPFCYTGTNELRSPMWGKNQCILCYWWLALFSFAILINLVSKLFSLPQLLLYETYANSAYYDAYYLCSFLMWYYIYIFICIVYNIFVFAYFIT